MSECKKSPNLFFKIHQNNDVQNKDIFIAISVIFIACKSYLEWLMNISSSGRQYWLKKEWQNHISHGSKSTFHLSGNVFL